jgi:hypothetical protein
VRIKAEVTTEVPVGSSLTTNPASAAEDLQADRGPVGKSDDDWSVIGHQGSCRG